MFLSAITIVLLATAQSVSAVGCATHTYGSCDDNIVHWYDPDDGMICDPLDCGGGRAPPKTTEPCCAAYTGTEACVTTTSYLSCFVSSTTVPTTAPESTDTTVTGDPSTIKTSVVTTPTSTLNPSSTTPSSTIVVTTTTQSSGANSSSPMTTSRASSGSATTGSGSSSRSSSTSPSPTPNVAGYAQCGSLMALAGAAVGVVLL